MRRLLLQATIGLLVLAFASFSSAAVITGPFSPLNFPGSIATVPLDINNSGQVVGQFAFSRGETRAFFFDGTSFEEIVVGGAIAVSAEGLNATGTAVGFFRAANNSIRGFVKNGSTILPYDVPIAGATRTILSDINDEGHLIGEYDDGTGNLFGFLDDGVSVTTYAFGTSATFAKSINNSNEFVGTHRPGTAQNRGYVAYGSSPTVLIPSAATSSQAFGINGSGYVIGDFHDAAGRHGFLWDGLGYATIDHPLAGPGGTFVRGINDEGDMVGAYASDDLGFRTSIGFIFAQTQSTASEPKSLALLAFSLLTVAVARPRAFQE